MEIKTATWGWEPPQYELVKDDIFKIYFNPVLSEETITYATKDEDSNIISETKTVPIYTVNYYQESNPELLEAINSNNSTLVSRILLKCRINAYDNSDFVNSFSLNGVSTWLDKLTRIGLVNSTTIAKNSGAINTTLWFGTNSFEVNCDVALALLSSLENYALHCYNVTAQHLADAELLASSEELDNYDYTAGYPDKLILNI